MKFNNKRIKPYFGISLPLLLVGIGFAFKNVPEKKNLSEDKIIWMTIEQAEAACQKKPKKIMIDVYTSWCGWCKKMDATTFTDPKVVSYMNEKFYAVKMDAESQNNLIFKDKVHKFNDQRNAHDLSILLMNGNMSYPTTVYLDEKLNVIQPIGGYLNASEFNKILHFFGENQYKKKTFEAFKKDFKEEIKAD